MLWIIISNNPMAFFLMMALIAAHTVTDFGLQSEFMAKFKSRTCGAGFWPTVLAAHAGINAAGVALICFLFKLPPEVVFAVAMFEFAIHVIIDVSKTEGVLGIPSSTFAFTLDQILHILTKLVIASSCNMGGGL